MRLRVCARLRMCMCADSPTCRSGCNNRMPCYMLMWTTMDARATTRAGIVANHAGDEVLCGLLRRGGDVLAAIADSWIEPQRRRQNPGAAPGACSLGFQSLSSPRLYHVQGYNA